LKVLDLIPHIPFADHYRHLLFTVSFCLVAGILLPHGLIEDESMNTPKNGCYVGKYKYPELEVLVECW